MKTFIYSLTDPITNQIRYVGKTVNLEQRLYNHINHAKTMKYKRHVCYWVNSLLKQGKLPIMTVLEECDINWQEREQYWIKQHKENLCNHTLGGEGRLGSRLFDNEEDIIDFFSARTFGVEMSEILKDKHSIGPVLLYLFHRIQASLDGSPTMIVLDEAWALIDNPVFAPKIKDWLKVLRKLNTFVVFATQSVEDAAKSSISDTLVQQSATQIFLPNLKATPVYREVFMLSEREFNLVKTTDPSTRYFLVKQDNDGVVARIDLSGMEEVIRVLSGRVDTVLLMQQIISEVGDDPDDWLPIFYERSK